MNQVGVSHVTYHVRIRSWATIGAHRTRVPGARRRHTVFMQIVLVSVVAVVFLVRLTFALHGRTHKR